MTREYYGPFDTAPKTGSAEVYLHEMPGGQYTNLKEQAASMGVSRRWSEIACTYADVNKLFGDIIKVTPSSKVVGDMALFLFSRGIKPADVINLEPGTTPFPESVIDMMMGGLGWPEGGWPEAVWLAILGKERFEIARQRYQQDIQATGKNVRQPVKVDVAALETLRLELSEKLHHKASDDALYSWLMYPQVFLDFVKQQKEFGNISTLPTPAFYYGLKPEQEISVDIEEGKTLIIRLVSVGEPDKDGRRIIAYELNGMARATSVLDKSIIPKPKARIQADLGEQTQVAAPIPGLIATLSVSVGAKVRKGDKLLMMESMKMQTTVYSPLSGMVAELHVAVGDNVETKDLLLKIRPVK
jgi:pyruvate carboxylase